MAIGSGPSDDGHDDGVRRVGVDRQPRRASPACGPSQPARPWVWGVSITSRPCDRGPEPRSAPDFLVAFAASRTDRRGVGQEGEDLRDSVDDLGDREDVLAAPGAGGGRAPDLRVDEDPAADQGVPVLGRGDPRGEQQVGPLVGRGPGPVGLAAPLADDVRPVGLPLAAGLGGDRAVAAPEDRAALGGAEARGGSSRGGRRSGRGPAPPGRRRIRARAASARRRRSALFRPVLRRSSASAFHCADSMACQPRRPAPALVLERP